MEKILMTVEEFKKWDKKIRAKILKHDATAVIESKFADMQIAVGGAENARAVWHVLNHNVPYRFILWERDGNIWELESITPIWSTSGNSKYIERVLADFYETLPKPELEQSRPGPEGPPD